MKKIRRRWFYYGIVVAAWAAYIVLTIAAPESSSSQQLQLNKVVVLILTVTLLGPYLLTWPIAIFGWYHFGRFAQTAHRKHLPTSAAFHSITRGLGLLILDLIAIPLFSATRNVLRNNEDAVVVLTMVSNYAHIVIPLAAFGFLFYGSHQLARLSNYTGSVRSRMLPSIIATSFFILIFSLAVFSNPSRLTAAESGTFATYYLSDPLILLTVIIPLAITWFLGLQTALNTERYVHALSKPQWKRAILRYFHGLLAVVCGAMILQGITMVGSQQLQEFNLALILVVIYLFIFLQAVGYLFIKSSGKQLRRLIESEPLK